MALRLEPDSPEARRGLADAQRGQGAPTQAWLGLYGGGTSASTAAPTSSLWSGALALDVQLADRWLLGALYRALGSTSSAVAGGRGQGQGGGSVSVQHEGHLSLGVASPDWRLELHAAGITRSAQTQAGVERVYGYGGFAAGLSATARYGLEWRGAAVTSWYEDLTVTQLEGTATLPLGDHLALRAGARTQLLGGTATGAALLGAEWRGPLRLAISGEMGTPAAARRPRGAGALQRARGASLGGAAPGRSPARPAHAGLARSRPRGLANASDHGARRRRLHHPAHRGPHLLVLTLSKVDPMRHARSLLLSLALLLAGSAALASDAVPDLYRQSYAAEARGDYGGAIESMERLGAASGTYVAQLRKGWLQYLAGRHAQAAEAYRRAAALEPASVEARLGGMLPLMALRRWKDAERIGEEVLALAPGDFTAVSRLAFIQYSQGQWAKAEPLYRRALAAWPSSAEMRTGLGWTLLKLGRFKEARDLFEAVLLYAPDQQSAREGLGLVP